ncbi:conserved protein of unknown function [Burkholderia multivorans]
MTVENDFLTFATGAGANVIDQPTYAALAALMTGFQAGTAQSAQLNKVWRQSSIMAAVLAQFIVAQTGQPAIDDGTTAALLANLIAGVDQVARTRLASPPAIGNTALAPSVASVNVATSQLAIPGAATGTGSTTGGTLAAATYYVKIVAVDSLGGTTAAGAESIGVATTGTTSSIAYTWPAVTGAASYQIWYGTAAGAEAAYYTSTTNSFTLTAAAGTAGTIPNTNTTGGVSAAGPVTVPPATKIQHAVQLGQIQTQAGTAFTTGGAAPNFTLTPTPALQGYAPNQRFRVKFNAAGTTGSNTLNISGLGAVALMQYDPNGVLIPAIVPSGLLSDVEYNGTNMVLLDPVAPVLRNYIAGLTLSNDGTNPNTQIDFAPGVAADSTNTYSMQLSATLVKTLQSSGAWVSGTGGNGLFSGVKAASTWYHCFLIRNGATGAVDAGFDTSVTAANIPSGWTAYRRVGSILTDGGGNIRAFTQVGDEFLWTVPLRDINTTGVGATTASYAVTIPPNVIVQAIIQGYASNSSGSTNYNINYPGASDVTSYLAPTMVSTGAALAIATGRIYVRSNTSQQIQIACSAAGNTLSFGAYGWRDLRGTNN